MLSPVTMNDIRQEKTCKRCGRCMDVCPLYRTTFREADVARGKLALLETMDPDAMVRSKRFKDILSRCLLCGACGEACANSVETKKRIQEGRQLLFETRRGRWLENPLVRSLRQGDLSGNIVQKGGALFQALCCKKIPQSSGLHLRFPLSFFTQRSTIPPIAWTPFLRAFHGKASKPAPSTQVGLFVGCGSNYLFPESAWALVRLLQQMGVSVVSPKGQVCCGLSAFVSGDIEGARALAVKNMEAFRSLGLDVVLTLCASCGAHLGQLGTLFEDDDPWRSEAAAFGSKHRDAMAFLMEDLDLGSFLRKHAGIRRPRGKAMTRIVCHEPCHLRIGQGGGKGTEQMLQSLDGVELVDRAGSGQCCGHGGGFNLIHYDLSMQILDRRIQGFQDAGLDAVVAGCTGCLLQFQEGVCQHGLTGRVEVCHPLVVVDRWLGPNLP